MHIYKTPGFVKSLLPGLVWNVKNTKKEIFLTFDDGPVPGVTDWVLDLLQQYKAKASFFVVGENVQKYPELFSRINEAGHAVGNHTQNHLNAWQSPKQVYMENIRECEQAMNGSNNKRLFRPPHGKLTPGIIRELRKSYTIIMWDVLSGDYNATISNEECLISIKEYTSDGSIIVFHDSYKAENKLKAVLPEYLKEFSLLGFSFRTL